MSAKERVIKAIGHGVGNLVGTGMEIGGDKYAKHAMFTLDPGDYLIGKGVSFAGNRLKKSINSSKR